MDFGTSDINFVNTNPQIMFAKHYHTTNSLELLNQLKWKHYENFHKIYKKLLAVNCSNAIPQLLL